MLRFACWFAVAVLGACIVWPGGACLLSPVVTLILDGKIYAPFWAPLVGLPLSALGMALLLVGVCRIELWRTARVIALFVSALTLGLSLLFLVSALHMVLAKGYRFMPFVEDRWLFGCFVLTGLTLLSVGACMRPGSPPARD